jgi:hypothetical protein
MMQPEALKRPPPPSPTFHVTAMNLTSSAQPIAISIALAVFPLGASSSEVYGGVGTTGGEIGIAQGVGNSLTARIDVDVLSYRSHFSTSGIDYDVKLKANNAGVYLDGFVLGGVRLTGGALIGSRTFMGITTGLGNTIDLNGVIYPVSPGDALSFNAKFPVVTPYLGLGYGHRTGAGFQPYADVGVAYGTPKVTLSPSASLATKVSPTDLAGEQSSVQDKADRYRAYPVLKIGFSYGF